MRRPSGNRLAVEDLKGFVDFCAAIHLVHEVPDKEVFVAEVWRALKPGGKLLVIEPKSHVTATDFSAGLQFAKRAGFDELEPPRKLPGRSVLLVKNTV
jgi:ubiquinone/menaquinone biosynthesis C-methylase UbiE